jgi:hypothetical protein
MVAGLSDPGRLVLDLLVLDLLVLDLLVLLDFLVLDCYRLCAAASVLLSVPGPVCTITCYCRGTCLPPCHGGHGGRGDMWHT